MRIPRSLAAAVLAITLAGAVGPASASPATLALLARMHGVFMKKNPNVVQVHVLDLISDAKRPGHRYAALATATTREPQFMDDELFGVFVLDSTLTKIERTVEILPTGRLLDYTVAISFASPDTLLVRGFGTADHGAAFRHAHAW